MEGKKTYTDGKYSKVMGAAKTRKLRFVHRCQAIMPYIYIYVSIYVYIYMYTYRT